MYLWYPDPQRENWFLKKLEKEYGRYTNLLDVTVKKTIPKDSSQLGPLPRVDVKEN